MRSVLNRWCALTALAAQPCILGCLSNNYVTPGEPAPFGQLTPKSVSDTLVLTPEAPWPAALAFTRVQAGNYRSSSGDGVKRAGLTLLGPKDLEREKDLAVIQAWPSLASVVRLTPILVSGADDVMLSLREGAATLHADILGLYTIDTDFHVDDRDLGPLSLITLGLAPTRNAVVNCTASIVFFDVRTGYCYGTAEGSAQDDQIGSAWTSRQALHDARCRAERSAFEALLGQAGVLWTAIATRGVPTAAPATTSDANSAPQSSASTESDPALP